jgi:hypothetical protein
MVLVQRLPLADWRLLTGVNLPRQPLAAEAVHDPERTLAAKFAVMHTAAFPATLW